MIDWEREGNKIVYYEIIRNSYLGVTKTIKANSEFEVRQKVEEQLRRWNIQEMRQREKDAEQEEKNYAEKKHCEAVALIDSYNSFLRHIAQQNYTLDFESLKRNETYGFIFNMGKPYSLDFYIAKHRVPDESFWERIFKGMKETRLERYNDAVNEHNAAVENYNRRYNEAYSEWEEKSRIFNLEQDNYNKSIDQWHTDYNNGNVEAIEKYISYVLDNFSPFPENIEKFIKTYALEYNSETHTLIISVKLPLIDNMPQNAGFKYIKTKQEISAIPIKKKDLDVLYDNVISQIVLSVIHIIFSSDSANVISAIAFNGYIDYIDPSTGNDTTSCIISAHSTKKDYKSINLKRVDAKECLKGLKVIRAASLSTLTPIKPIMQLNKNDKRFIPARSVLEDIEVDYNLSEMPWEDFEHLVRELFEILFSQDGAEVKVTKASKDGGVDAVAFDPDPIRGGKFVIQAKRYTKVVPVSAVRDLYGTMINEGANRGILVTTSHYGHDTYSFAKDKPISLVDGNNLVYLLKKAGYMVKVNK